MMLKEVPPAIVAPKSDAKPVVAPTPSFTVIVHVTCSFSTTFNPSSLSSPTHAQSDAVVGVPMISNSSPASNATTALAPAPLAKLLTLGLTVIVCPTAPPLFP